jgi:SAM-dependent methyltransferase
MATEFPKCEFLGIDIAPPQPTTVLPRNCSFELVNVLEGIPKPDNWFDYIHQRLLIAAIPAAKWEQHIQECARVCTSDGWIEIVEPDSRIFNGGPACQQLNTWFADGLKSRGIDIDMVHRLDELMREAGLINVTKQTFNVPAGEFLAENFRLANLSLQPLFTNALGVSKEEVEKNGTLMMEELKSHQAHLTIYVYLGQKK